MYIILLPCLLSLPPDLCFMYIHRAERWATSSNLGRCRHRVSCRFYNLLSIVQGYGNPNYLRPPFSNTRTHGIQTQSATTPLHSRFSQQQQHPQLEFHSVAVLWAFELCVSSGKPAPLNRLKGNFISITLTEYLDFGFSSCIYLSLSLLYTATTYLPLLTIPQLLLYVPNDPVRISLQFILIYLSQDASLIASPCKSGRARDLPN